MSRLLALVLIVIFIKIISGCAGLGQSYFPTEDTLTPGIFMEEGAKEVLPAGVVLRQIYPKGIRLTKTSEGFRSHLYNDAARYCTIAYGHLVKRASCDGSEPAAFLRGLAEPAGAQLLIEDMARAQIAVTKLSTIELTNGQYAALCDFVYNVGVSKFERSSLLKAVNAEQHDRVAGEFGRWVMAGGRVLEGLKRRREREIELFFDGIEGERALPPVDMDVSPIDIREGEPEHR